MFTKCIKKAVTNPIQQLTDFNFICLLRCNEKWIKKASINQFVFFSFMHAPPETQVQLDRPLSTEHGRKKKEENPTKVEQIFRTRA